MTDQPCHIVARPGDGKAMCGSKDLPVIWQAHIAMHQSKRSVELCPTCETMMDATTVAAGAGLALTRGSGMSTSVSQTVTTGLSATAQAKGTASATGLDLIRSAEALLEATKALDSRLDRVISKTTKPNPKGSPEMAHVAILQDDTLIIRPPGQAPVATVRLANPADIDAVLTALLPFLPNGNGNGAHTTSAAFTTNITYDPAVAKAPFQKFEKAEAEEVTQSTAPKAKRAKPAPLAEGEEPRKRGRQPAIPLTQLIDWLDDRPGATANEVAQSFELTPVIASRVLARAHEQGALVREGGGKRNDPYRYYTVETEAGAEDEALSA